MSGRGAGAVSGHSQGEGGVFQIPGAAAEDPTGGQGGSVHLHPRYAGERRVKCSSFSTEEIMFISTISYTLNIRPRPPFLFPGSSIK